MLLFLRGAPSSIAALAAARRATETRKSEQHGFTKPGPAWQEKADKESWSAMKKFFAEIFR